jgi:hypothetical protein
LAKGSFTFALRVHVGCIEEVNAGFDGTLDELIGTFLVDGANVPEGPLPP